MSGPVLDFDPGAVRRLPTGQPVDTRDAPGVLDTIVAGFNVARADTTGVVEADQVDAYKPIIEALIELEPGATFTRYVNPSTGTVSPQSVWRDVERYRRQGRFQELPATLDAFEKQWRAKRKAEIEEAERTSARGNAVASFIGGVAGAMTDPVNLYTLPVGGAGKTVAMRVLTEGLVNAGIEAALLPQAQRNREALGRPDLTAGEAALNVVLAGVGGAAIRGGIEVAPAAGRAINERVIQPVRNALDPNAEAKAYAKAFEQMVPAHLRTPEQDAALFVLRRAGEVEDVNPYVRTHEGIDAHTAKMEAALRALEEGRIAAPAELTSAASPIPAPSPVARPVSVGPVDFGSVKAAIAGPESGGDDFATNRMGSSAAGRYQFIEGTFVSLYARVFRVSAAEAERAWNSNRKFDVGVQEALMDRLLADNAAALERAGIAADPGNLYLAHFAGAGKAIELLRAPREARVADFFSAKAIRQNPTYLGGGKTVGEAIDIIRGKVGDPGQRSPAPIDPALLEPELRNPDLDAERPATPLIDEKAADAALPEPVQSLIDPLRDIVTGTRLSLNRTGELAAELGTDEATLREALTALVERGDITQNRATGKFMRKAAAPVTAANQKRPRTLLEFLAERGGLNDWGGDLASRGIRPGTRKVGAKVIRNARRKDGTVIPGEGEWGLDRAFQAARDEGYFPEFEGRTEDNYGDALDGAALLLQAIDEELAGSPRYRMDDWDRLPEFKLTGSTEGIYGGRIGPEDADPDDFGAYAELVEKFREEWSAFGNDPGALEGLDADTLSRAAWLYDNGDAFLPEHALAMVASADYERALKAAIREGLADEYPELWPFGREFNDELERRFNAAVARDRADGSPLPRPEGVSFDEAFGGQGSAQPRDGQPSGPEQAASPAELDAAAAARPRSDHTDLPPDPDPRFDEPDGPGIVAAAESAWHDIRVAGETPAAATITESDIAALPPVREGYIRMWHGGYPGTEAKAPGDGGRWFSSNWQYARDYRNEAGTKALFYVDIPENHPAIDSFNIDEFTNVRRGVTANAELPEEIAIGMRQVGKAESPAVDPNIAARQRQEAQLGAEAPMRATTEQDGTMGLGLFDAVDQRSLFDLGDGRGERTVADIRAELDANKAAIETMRSCLT